MINVEAHAALCQVTRSIMTTIIVAVTIGGFLGSTTPPHANDAM